MRRSLLRMVAVGAWLAVATGLSDTAQAQIASLVSPGPLSKAHASLEGAANCQKCHEAGKKVTADRCLTCHKPIALRIAARRGVHRDVTGDCVTCHVEHAGVDAELRPLDVKRFDHAAETGFALVGRHAPIAPTCVKCHKTRSFLTARPECRSCHADPHQGKLGDACATCHAMNAPFAAARTGFDHSKAAFPLTGAHTRVQCATCHKAREYRGLKFAACSDCHASPHKPAFPGACTSCHTDVAWKTTKVNHGATAFPLVGKHAAVECRACHKAPGTMVGARLKFAKCSDCHADPHRGQFKEDCAACHKETGFAKAAFDHGGRTAFPLTDRHAAIACTACHKRATSPGAMRAAQVSFKGLVVACSSCHKDPHAGELGTKCESCHKAAGFRIPGYTHTKASDFFGGQHSAIACAQCHAPRGAVVSAASRVTDGGWKFAGVATRCSTCHTDVHRGQLGDRCESCHSVSAAKFALVGFSHDKTAYPLSGKHAALQCASCHKRETGTFPAGAGTAVRFKGLGVTCASCHRDVHLGQLGNQCERCHATTGFARPNYAHAAGPAFFAGAHGKLVCAACHKKQEAAFPSGRGVAVRYAGFGKECSTCHADRHNGTLGGACQTCHTPAGWPIVSRAFHKAGQFPLQGKHLTVECASCHLNGVIKGTPTQCYACHWVRRRDDRYQTRLGSQCESCHTPVSWTSVRWNHAASSGVSLNAQHRALGCDSCHVNQQFRPGTVVCTNCHRADYDRTQAPNHAAAGFPLQCELCHRPSDARFSSAVFAHASAFPLVGVHATQGCAACHRNNVYKGTPRDCFGCHQADYQRTQNPNHAAAGFPTACESCHRPTDPSFKGASFNHANVFALVGVHATQACAACHRNNVYKGTPRECFGCHQADYQRTQEPNHAAAGFPTACESCHRASDPSFKGAGFNHAGFFPLVGVHATQACVACHKSGVYKGTPRDCYSCHQADYQRTQNPNHASSGFSTSCETCHRPTDPSFKGGTFNHASVFPLVGVHATQACVACHKNGVYKGTPRDCYSCHQADYQRTQNPNHAASGFSTSCETCHRPTDPSFKGGTFNHASVFPLVGVHATQACVACHKSGVYKGTPRDCYSCHQADYQRTQNPNHAAAGFPTTCESCHRASDSSFKGATFNHAWFPIASGRHAGNPCSACHTDSNNYKVFTCLTCHGRAQTDSHHVGRAGYRYDSLACYSCHPQGRT